MKERKSKKIDRQMVQQIDEESDDVGVCLSKKKFKSLH